MDAPDLLARLPRWDDGAGHRSVRLARAIAAAIGDGRLTDGTSLPSERPLAAKLEVSRGTVVRAYDRLRADGLVHTRRGAGTVVGADGTAVRGHGPPGGLRADSIVATVGNRDTSTIDLRVASWDADDAIVALLGQTPTMSSAIRGQDGYHPVGLPELRRELAAHLTATGLPTLPEQLLITGGAQQAVDTVLSTLCRPGDPVLVEDTSWPGIFELLSIRHLRPSPVAVAAADHLPLLRALRERRADLAYLVPTFHNPTGTVLPAHVRRMVVEAAAEGGALLVDDLTMAELWIDRPPPPPLATVVPEAADHVITIGSLSKSLWGGLRVGWLRAEERLFRQLARVKAVLDLGTSVPSQLTALTALPHIDEIVAGRRDALREHRRVLLDGLATHLPDWTVTPPAGGLSVWVDTGVPSADGIVERARARGVRVPPAAACTATDHDLGHLRLTLSRPASELAEATRRLGAAAEEQTERDHGKLLGLAAH